MSFNSTLTERINETLSGTGAPVVLRVIGNNLRNIQAATGELTAALRKVPGAATVVPQTPWFAPRISIRLRRRHLAMWGLTPRDALNILPLATDGLVVGHVYHGVRIRPVVLRLPGVYRHSVSALKHMPIPTPRGFVPLDAIARIRQTVGFYRISHFDSQRAQMINIHLTHTTAGAFVTAARTAIRHLHLPAGIHIEFAGSAAAQQKAASELLERSLLAALIIIIILNIPFGSWPPTLLLIINLPLAFLGGLIAIAITGHNLSLGALVGLVTLMGITMRNGIMLLCHYRHLVHNEGRTWNYETAVEGAVDRLPAIIMTALIAVVGLLPLAMGAGAPGQEIEGPLAIVVVGGVVTSTLLNLIIVPILAARFCRFTSATDADIGGQK
jgi:Cu/Ag efflux pump CusA